MMRIVIIHNITFTHHSSHVVINSARAQINSLTTSITPGLMSYECLTAWNMLITQIKYKKTSSRKHFCSKIGTRNSNMTLTSKTGYITEKCREECDKQHWILLTFTEKDTCLHLHYIYIHAFGRHVYLKHCIQGIHFTKFMHCLGIKTMTFRS